MNNQISPFRDIPLQELLQELAMPVIGGLGVLVIAFIGIILKIYPIKEEENK